MTLLDRERIAVFYKIISRPTARGKRNPFLVSAEPLLPSPQDGAWTRLHTHVQCRSPIHFPWSAIEGPTEFLRRDANGHVVVWPGSHRMRRHFARLTVPQAAESLGTDASHGAASVHRAGRLLSGPR